MSKAMPSLHTKPLDFLLLILFALAVTGAFFALRGNRKGSPLLVITTPEGEFVYPLSEDKSYRMEGLLGTSVIEVRGGQAYFADSPCPNKTCVQSGPISAQNSWAACLPNDVFIRIERQDEGVDALAR
mgnify:CR=1 FL=1